MSARVIIVNTPGPVGPRGPGGIYEGTGSLTISGSVAATSSFWNIATSEFQIVSDPTYFTNHFFLVKNQYNELKLGTLSVDAGLTLTTQADSAFIISNTTADVFTLTGEGVAYFASQPSLPNPPTQGGLLFSGSDFFVST